ncbi:DegT/DnrJ/EryC1/StrS aminotransferase [hydrothermal vent metagenome]|uniref:DegT/DnrJ/EryC1/StrS aminotransferase n=1 Tax=hydrothermal vent metagenome TaxID=652676 RepID=A0A3B0YD52_9ZZZZ
MPRVLAPTGSPVSAAELGHWLTALLTGQDPRPAFAEAICQHFSVPHCHLFSTGRAAMSFLFGCLAEMNNDPARTEIVVPAYTCYSVASSALMAGLHVRVCDIDPDTLSYDLEQLRSIDFSRVLAVTTANLYGMPDNLPEIDSITREHGVFLVDDAAQSMQARIAGRFSGTWGIAGLFSLDKGKNITAIQGGMIVTENNELENIIVQRYSRLPENGHVSNIKEYIKLLVYFSLLHPSLYWMPASLPFLHLGETRYEDDYPINRLPRTLAAISNHQLSRVEAITAIRLGNAERYIQTLGNTSGPGRFSIIDGAEPVFLRYPVRMKDKQARRNFLGEYAGLGVTASYPQSISDVEEIRSVIRIQNEQTPNARQIAREIVTLPTHAYVRPGDIENICKELVSATHG